MDDIGSGQKVLEWITLVLALIFIVMGISVVSGIFFPERMFLEGAMRYVLGFILIGYGLVRLTMISRRLKREKRQKPFAEKT
ncbi:MAG: hypothetical protein JSU85_08030 [Candidatus Zixiibacteriota bacterium]|nr:MAG: hypothetical protein JSU85_08030 [candidate division Zixibacteria bacterium]